MEFTVINAKVEEALLFGEVTSFPVGSVKYKIMVADGVKAICAVASVQYTDLNPPAITTEDAYKKDKFGEISHDRDANVYRKVRTAVVSIHKNSMGLIRAMQDNTQKIDSGISGVAQGDVYIFAGDLLKDIAKKFLPVMTELRLAARGHFQINRFLLPLVKLPNMAEHLLAYTMDVDIAVKLFTNDTPEADWAVLGSKNDAISLIGLGFGVDDSQPLPEPRVTDSEMYALAYTLLFCCVKTGDNQFVKMALAKRLDSLKNDMKMRDFNTEGFFNKYFSENDFKEIYNGLAFFPNLKSNIFSTVLGITGSQFNDHIRAILKESQLTVFNMIVTFCMAEELTCLHIVDEVMADYAVFGSTWKAIQDRYGDCWPYCKLLNPSETMTNLNKFPYLAMAAKAYAYTLSGAASLKNLKGMKNVPQSYFRAASLKLLKGAHLTNKKAEDVIATLNKLPIKANLVGLTDELIKEVRERFDQSIISPTVIEMLSQAV